jgi:hypothetical protein
VVLSDYLHEAAEPTQSGFWDYVENALKMRTEDFGLEGIAEERPESELENVYRDTDGDSGYWRCKHR